MIEQEMDVLVGEDDRAGCEKCRNTRFDPVNIDDDNGDMIIRCRKCGAVMVIKGAFTVSSPNRDGRVFTHESLRKANERLHAANRSLEADRS